MNLAALTCWGYYQILIISVSVMVIFQAQSIGNGGFIFVMCVLCVSCVLCFWCMSCVFDVCNVYYIRLLCVCSSSLGLTPIFDECVVFSLRIL